MQREKGTVKWFNSEKGFGFIVRDCGGDIFVHFKSINSSGGYKYLDENQRVEYDVVSGRKGLQADNVSVIN